MKIPLRKAKMPFSEISQYTRDLKIQTDLRQRVLTDPHDMTDEERVEEYARYNTIIEHMQRALVHLTDRR